MAEHGYLPEYDHARGEDHQRRRDDERSAGERDRNFMLDSENRDRGAESERFGAEDQQYRNTRADRWAASDREQFRSFRDRPDDQSRSRFSNRQHDHYLSWRQKQMDALDREYEEYCREREQQFHSDFDEWRRRRQGNPEPLRTGMTQTGLSSDPSGELQLTEDQRTASGGGSDPMATATLGNEGGAGR